MPYLLPTSILGKNLDWVPFAGRLIWFSIILVAGLALTYLTMKPAKFPLPMPKSRLLILTLFVMALIYTLGAFVQPIQVLCFWINLLVFFSSIALVCVTTTVPASRRLTGADRRHSTTHRAPRDVVRCRQSVCRTQDESRSPWRCSPIVNACNNGNTTRTGR